MENAGKKYFTIKKNKITAAERNLKFHIFKIGLYFGPQQNTNDVER